MTISFELPPGLGELVGHDADQLSRRARESFLVDLYRERAITHFQLAEALGLTRFETDGLLKDHRVSLELSDDDLRREAESLDRVVMP